MILNILNVVLGIVLVLYGADVLTKGSCGLARRLKVSEMMIGLTIVAFGTSMPEFVISFVSALGGSADLAVGNVVGSNVFNSLCIVGIAAMVCPISILRSTVRKDMPFAMFASIILIVMCIGFGNLSLKGNLITRFDGVILLLCFAFFMIVTLRNAKKSVNQDGVTKTDVNEMKIFKVILYLLIGLGLLIGGSECLVKGAKSIAQMLNVSESIIGLTIVACGTSLPELATSVVAAKKGSPELAIGNVIGSNVFNILWILGATSLVCPLNIQGITIVDIAMMFLGMLILWLFSFTQYKVERWEGVVMFLLFLGYMFYLVY